MTHSDGHNNRSKHSIHALIFAAGCTLFLFLVHILPVNHLFIDPFSVAIKNHDIMDVSLSKFRNHNKIKFDKDVLILNTEVTNKEEIAKSIDLLLKSGVGAIGVDILFENDQEDADTLLSKVLKDPRVVLGYSFKEINKKTHASKVDLCSSSLFTSGTQQGYVNLATDDGFSVRAFEPVHKVNENYDSAFAIKVIETWKPGSASDLTEKKYHKEWINFRRKQPGKMDMVFPVNKDKHVHYSMTSVREFLADSSSYSKAFLKDKIVLFGFSGENEKAHSMKDRYFTPLNEKYYGRAIPDMHGVVIHANIISMIRDKDYIRQVSDSTLYAIAFVLFALNYLLFVWLVRKKPFFLVPTVRVFQAIQFILLFTFCVYMMSVHSIKFGFLIIITSVIFAFELYEFYHHKIQHKLPF